MLKGSTHKEDDAMLYTIIGVLVVLWLLGFIAHIGGGLIHLLLVAAAIVFIYHLITGRHSTV
jgi:4-hydroxybenzoate polyprenyltransferase